MARNTQMFLKAISLGNRLSEKGSIKICYICIYCSRGAVRITKRWSAKVAENIPDGRIAFFNIPDLDNTSVGRVITEVAFTRTFREHGLTFIHAYISRVARTFPTGNSKHRCNPGGHIGLRSYRGIIGTGE
jgi:hypothetical protein